MSKPSSILAIWHSRRQSLASMCVGCQSGDDAIYLLHGLSRFVPHFIALNAASPWFDSTDSRFACSRLNRFSSYPDNGPMPWVADWQGFRRLFRQLSHTSMIDSMKDLHWDIRPSPQFGTVEVRVMDTLDPCPGDPHRRL